LFVCKIDAKLLKAVHLRIIGDKKEIRREKVEESEQTNWEVFKAKDIEKSNVVCSICTLNAGIDGINNPLEEVFIEGLG
jgi:hypothetical protein